jgi:hypothetical protein
MAKHVDVTGRRSHPFNKKLKRAGELGKKIRPQISGWEGGPVPQDPADIEAANARLERLHDQAVSDAHHHKLKLLLRHYSLDDDDWHGLALALAIEHEPGFQVDRQIAPLPSGFEGAVRIKDGKIITERTGRPRRWSVERLGELHDAVDAEKKKFGLKKDIEALRYLARRKKWAPPSDQSRSSRGSFAAWVTTLQKRLVEAREIQRSVDKLEAEVNRIRRQMGIDRS